MLTDSHAHLSTRPFHSDLDAVVARALDVGVTRMVAIGCDLVSSRECLAIADRFPGVWATVGVHPTNVTEVMETDWLDQLKEMTAHPRCAAMGEMGLDYYHPAPKGWTEADYRGRQQEFFSAQLALAADVRKNVVVHQRDRAGIDCWRDIVSIVRPWNRQLRAVFHCWTLPWAEAEPMVDEGHLISFTGIATYAHAPDVALCAATARAGTFMLETDSPYIPPVPHRGKRNEPAYLRHTAEKIAELRGISVADLTDMTNGVANSFFHFLK